MTHEMSDDHKRAIWAEIIEATRPPPPLGPGEKTAADLADIMNISTSTATRWAKAQVEAGVLEHITRLQRGHIINAWRPIPPSDNGAGA